MKTQIPSKLHGLRQEKQLWKWFMVSWYVPSLHFVHFDLSPSPEHFSASLYPAHGQTDAVTRSFKRCVVIVRNYTTTLLNLSPLSLINSRLMYNETTFKNHRKFYLISPTATVKVQVGKRAEHVRVTESAADVYLPDEHLLQQKPLCSYSFSRHETGLLTSGLLTSGLLSQSLRTT